MPEGVVTIDELWLTFLIGTVLPMLVAVIKSRYASSGLAGTILVLLSVVSGWLVSLQATGGRFEVEAAIVAIFITFITAVGMHFGLLKPNRVTGNDGVIIRAIPGGVGSGRHRRTGGTVR